MIPSACTCMHEWEVQHRWHKPPPHTQMCKSTGSDWIRPSPRPFGLNSSGRPPCVCPWKSPSQAAHQPSHIHKKTTKSFQFPSPVISYHRTTEQMAPFSSNAPTASKTEAMRWSPSCYGETGIPARNETPQWRKVIRNWKNWPRRRGMDRWNMMKYDEINKASVDAVVVDSTDELGVIVWWFGPILLQDGILRIVDGAFCSYRLIPHALTRQWVWMHQSDRRVISSYA